MPTYVFECPFGHMAELSRSVDSRDDPATCDCGEPMCRILTSPKFHIGDSMMEPADYDRKYGPGAAGLIAYDRDHRRATGEGDSGFKGPAWARP